MPPCWDDKGLAEASRRQDRSEGEHPEDGPAAHAGGHEGTEREEEDHRDSYHAETPVGDAEDGAPPSGAVGVAPVRCRRVRGHFVSPPRRIGPRPWVREHVNDRRALCASACRD